MMRKGILLKSVAVFLILETVVNTVAPAISWALTAGPTAPEATSFEPVDTTDMVNLATGDLAYNIPLLEVPGPSGGYPLSLSYHAGIQPNEEASWVGLGWTLNPGAIARTVNGYPDDQVGARRTRVDHFEGERSTYMASIGLPGVGFGLSVSNDSNMGVGVGAGLSLGASIGNVSVGANFDVSAYGDESASVGVGANFGKVKAGLYLDRGGVSATVGAGTSLGHGLGSVGLSTNFNSLSASYSNSFYSVGASLTSKGLKASHSVAGIPLSQSNSQAGNMHTSSWGFVVPIPLGYSGLFLNLGYNYQRYYSHESSDVSVIGSLQASHTSGKDPDNWAFDSYALRDSESSLDADEKDPEKARGGSFPAYDSYQVNAQGLNGSMQPYIFQNGTLFRQNLKYLNDNTRYHIKYHSVNGKFNFSTGKINFRFKNDFANALNTTQDQMRVVNDHFDFTGQYSPGYDISDHRLEGSKHTEWFTNADIQSGAAKEKGFIDYKPYSSRETSIYGYQIDQQIGGFSITNENGVVYHYALPAYAYDEYSKSFLKGDPDNFYQSNDTKHPYVYTWYLTAITGTDYVDRNNNGIADNDDWGYWVNFSYGKWSSDFKWRNPAVGFHLDLDQKTQFFSKGSKELFYLDAIRTQSHIALFAKSPRKDFKGLSDNSQTPAFGYIPSQNGTDCTPPSAPSSTLKLDHIYLLTASAYETYLNENNLGTLADLKSKSADGGYQYGGCNGIATKFFHNRNEVLETEDLNAFALESIKQKSVRVISFDTDYSLCEKTINSFDFDYVSPSPELPVQRGGKLTLNSLSFLGNRGESLMPAMKFKYKNNPDYNPDAYDMWGFYKSDYEANSSNNSNKLRATTPVSAQNIDAWSMSEVSLSLGSKVRIVYEPDTYYRAIISNNYDFYIKRLAESSVAPGQFRLELNATSLPAYKFKTGEDIWLHFAYVRTRLGGSAFCEFGQFPNQLFEGAVRITEVGEDYLLVDAPALSQAMGTISNPCTESSSLSHGYATPLNKTGGGLRVAKIELSQINSLRTTRYSYSHGITSFEPALLEEKNPGYIPEWYQHLFKSFKLFYISREVPAPGVIYSKVTLEEELLTNNEVIPIPGRKEFEFQTFNAELVEHIPREADFDDPYVYECFAENGNDVPCQPVEGTPPELLPFTCKDQYGNPISCTLDKGPIEKVEPVTINDYTSFIGVLKSRSVYSQDGKMIEKSTMNYLHDNVSLQDFKFALDTRFKNQGVITHRFNEYRTRDHEFGTSEYKVFNKKVEYPLVTLGQTTVNYKTGIKSSSVNYAFDFYSGSPVKVLNTDGYGNAYFTETVPAYHIDAYSGMTEQQITNQFAGMGLKSKNPKNKHMLSQAANSYVYKVDPADPLNTRLGLVNAAVQTWSDQIPSVQPGNEQVLQTGVWRKHASYSYTGNNFIPVTGDGLLPLVNNTLPSFNAWNIDDATPEGWQRNAALTLYDINSHALQAIDINGNYAATKMSSDQTLIFASATNSRYDEFAFSGAEDYLINNMYGGGVEKADGQEVVKPYNSADPSITHTGNRALKLMGSGEKAFRYSFSAEPKRNYHSSVWTNSEAGKLVYSVNNVVPADIKVTIRKAGHWYQLSADITDLPPNASIVVWCETTGAISHFDDFRVHPVDAAMTSYVYNQWGALSHILDTNNIYTEFSYDAMGRLKETFKERLDNSSGLSAGKYKTSEITYHYTNQN